MKRRPRPEDVPMCSRLLPQLERYCTSSVVDSYVRHFPYVERKRPIMTRCEAKSLNDVTFEEVFIYHVYAPYFMEYDKRLHWT